jgi:uncharacterized membrane protein
MLLFPVVFILLGILFIGLALPMMRRRIKPNPLYGIRVAATFADEWVWYEANAAAGRDLAVFGLIQIAVALTLAFWPAIPVLAYLFINLAVLGIGTIVFAIVSLRRANRLLKQRRGSGGRAAAPSAP